MASLIHLWSRINPNNSMKNKNNNNTKKQTTKKTPKNPTPKKVQTQRKPTPLFRQYSQHIKINHGNYQNNKFFNIYIFCCSPVPPILPHCLHENYSWSRLPIEIFLTLFLEVFKIRLNADLRNCFWPQSCSCLSRSWGYRLPEVPFHSWFCGSRVL